MSSPPDILDHPRYAAVHRALLTGLVSNIGYHLEQREYQGARGRKFHIWPGSTLAKHRPEWVVSAELVETTRLYARTVAKIRPEWVEHAAEHLIKRTYDEIRWDKDAGEVVADEKVTLWGMTLVPKRVVPYGPIDPRRSREIFIQQALVEGNYRSEAPFSRHNRRLMDEIRAMESKARARDVLVEDKVRFDFYDHRIPAGLYNAAMFEQWRRHAEKHHPRLLFMDRRDLMLHGAEGITADAFPDTLHVRGLSLPLQYHFEPGHAMDGVTVTVPLAVVTQLSPEPFEWLVPGLLREKLIALVKTLPKQIRTQFVPVPDAVDRLWSSLKFGDGPLRESLAQQLGKLSGTDIFPDAIDTSQVPDHLKMNFRVVDERGRQLAMARDLADVQRKLAQRVKESFAHLPRSQWVRDNLKSWDFGDLPERVNVQYHGFTLYGYPALVDQGNSVAMRMFDSPQAAQTAMRAGLKRLFMVQLRHEMKFMEKHLPGIDRMSLYYSPLGKAEDLRSDLANAIADRVFLSDRQDIRTHAEYEVRLRTAWQRIAPIGRELSELAEAILSEFHTVSLQLDRDFPPLWRESINDMRQQLACLVPKNFISATPDKWLSHVPRFLKGIEVRLKKLANAGLSRDRANLADVRPLWEACLDRMASHRQAGMRDPALVEYRWMLEELRISLFAQELKTSMPISPKRLSAQWAQVRA